MKRGRPLIGERPMTSTERNRRRIDRLKAAEASLRQWSSGMTPDDVEVFLNANPSVVDHAMALVVRVEGEDAHHWRLVMGGKQADGVFRHVDASIGDLPKIALETLQQATEARF